MSNWGVLNSSGICSGIIATASGGDSSGGVFESPGAWASVMILPYDVDRIDFMQRYNSNANICEFGIGSPGNEVGILVPMCEYNNGTLSTVPVPMRLRAGTRIAARSIGRSGGQWVACLAYPADSYAPTGYAHWLRLGGNENWTRSPAPYSDIIYDPGGTASTRGGWMEVLASVPFDVRWAVVSTMHSGSNSTSMVVFDLGIGSLGNEQAVASNISGASATYLGPCRSFPVSIPAGSRLSINMQTSQTNSVTRVQQVWIALGG